MSGETVFLTSKLAEDAEKGFGPTMVNFFQILAVILAGIAAYFFWNGSTDGVFVAAVLGAVSFFLSIRFQVKNRLNRREKERLSSDQSEN